MTVCLLLTGRKNSSLKNKSFVKVLETDCIDIIIRESVSTPEIDHFFCSSDCKLIINRTIDFNFQPIIRPSSLGDDDAQHIDVIIHAIDTIKSKYSINPSILIITLANNPIIFNYWISLSVRLILDDPTLTSVVPVYEYSDHSPLRSKEIDAEGILRSPVNLFMPKHLSSNRQSLPKAYFLCHNFWTLNLNSWSQSNEPAVGDPPWNFMGSRTKPIIVPKSHDIHIDEDIPICEKILSWYNFDKKRISNVLSF